MTQEKILDMMQSTLFAIITVGAAPLIMGLTAGLVMSIFQAVTSIQEATLAFVPKILAVLFALIIFGSFMMSTLEDYTLQLFNDLPNIVSPR